MLYTCQRLGRVPSISASLPGQEVVAVRTPTFSAPTQIGSPPHQPLLVTASRSPRLKRPSAGSSMLLLTMPWWSGRRPVTRV